MSRHVVARKDEIPVGKAKAVKVAGRDIALTPAYLEALAEAADAADALILAEPYLLPALEHLELDLPVVYDAYNVEADLKAHAYPATDIGRALLAEVKIGSEDVLSFQLSGGTTGVPKIIPRFHAEYIGHSRDCAARFGYATSDGSSIWNLPLVHNAGQLYMLLPCVLFGRTIYLQSRIDIPKFCGWIERYKITHAASIGPVARHRSVLWWVTQPRAPYMALAIRAPVSAMSWTSAISGSTSSGRSVGSAGQ